MKLRIVFNFEAGSNIGPKYPVAAPARRAAGVALIEADDSVARRLEGQPQPAGRLAARRPVALYMNMLSAGRRLAIDGHLGLRREAARQLKADDHA